VLQQQELGHLATSLSYSALGLNCQLQVANFNLQKAKQRHTNRQTDKLT